MTETAAMAGAAGGAPAYRRAPWLVTGALGMLGRDLVEVLTDRGIRVTATDRHNLDITKISEELGYTPQVSLTDGLASTVTWYRENRDWWEPLKARAAICCGG